jgi:selenide,water dikinase
MPFTRGARRYADQWIFPGGSADNKLFYGDQVHFDPQIDEASQMLLFDAQTSGGLLLAVPPAKLASFISRAAEVEQPVWVVGEVLAGAGIQVDP